MKREEGRKGKDYPYIKKVFKAKFMGCGGEGWGLVIHLKSIGSYIKKVNNIDNIERAGSRADQS